MKSKSIAMFLWGAFAAQGFLCADATHGMSIFIGVGSVICGILTSSYGSE